MTAVELQRRVRERARDACEFCLQPQGPHELRFPIDHVIPRQHGGPTALSNLAVACHRCNLHKGPNLTGLDPDTGKLAGLYNPRRQRWATHFATVGARIAGRTAIGRTTAPCST